jgi:tetratricopeptide (TPR) repeat protein
MVMKKTEPFRKFFSMRELEENLQEAQSRLQKELKNKDFTIAAFYSFDVAYIYELLRNRKKAEHYYRTTLYYLDRATVQFLWVRQECLLALGEYQEALETALNDPHHSKLELAELYRKAGEYEISRQLFAELAMEKSEEIIWDMFFKPHFLQETSDLWSKACNMEKAREYNLQALEVWEKMKDTIQEPMELVEEAWLYEEVGYIYEKAGKFETALKYYEKAKSKYKEAYTEDPHAVFTHQVDGDWDYYQGNFFVQFLGLRIYKLRVEHPMKYDHRRIRYRILNLKEQIGVQY